jgi:spermidine synthase
LRPLLFVAFWASGVAGLLYELAWSRYLALFVGHAAYAQVLVISVFLGGLAVGSLAVGDKSRNLRRPLAWYAAAELVLCLAGIAFHPAFRGITGLAYDSWLPALGSPALAGVVQWGVAGLLILPQSVLLGTTFPLMAAGALRLDPRGAGNTVALLYFVNSLGGAGGVLLGGFVLIAWAGLPGAVLGAAALNAVAAGLALWVSGRAADRSSAAGELERAALADSPWTLPDRVSQQGLWSVLLGLSFFTALASFIYEIGWIRMLSLVMGSATHSFEIMLSAFILGLAIGSWWIRRAVDRSTRPLRLLGWIQWTMGLTALATLPVYEGMFDVMAFLVRALPEREGAYALFSLSRYGMALAVMLPSTICAGMSLPLITGTLLHAGAGERSLGWVYGINTLGSVVGVALAGLLLLPSLGLQGMLVAGAALDMALGVALFAYAAWAGWGVRRRLVPLAAVAGAGAAALVVSSARFDEAVLTSGVFRYGTVPNPDDRAMLFYRDGRTATVAVHRESSGLTVQSTNGKPDASLGERWMRSISEDLEPAPIYWQDEATQVLVAVAVMAHAPAARSAAMVGHGSGITGHYLLAKPDLERLVTIEIEPEMIRGSRLYYPANRRVFDDPRSVVVIDDAKAYFSNRQERFEVIVSEPSNPWVSGTASLFTVEFYQRLGDYLTDDGVFGQWFQLYEMTDESVVSVLTALHQGFRHYRAFLVGTTDLMVIATNADRLPDPDWDVARYPALVEDLSHVHPLDPIHLNVPCSSPARCPTPTISPGSILPPSGAGFWTASRPASTASAVIASTWWRHWRVAARASSPMLRCRPGASPRCGRERWVHGFGTTAGCEAAGVTRPPKSTPVPVNGTPRSWPGWTAPGGRRAGPIGPGRSWRSRRAYTGGRPAWPTPSCMAGPGPMWRRPTPPPRHARSSSTCTDSRPGTLPPRLGRLTSWSRPRPRARPGSRPSCSWTDPWSRTSPWETPRGPIEPSPRWCHTPVAAPMTSGPRC